MAKLTREQKVQTTLGELGIPKEVATKLIQHIGLDDAVASATLVTELIARTHDQISPTLNGKAAVAARIHLRRIMLGISYDYGSDAYPDTWNKLRRQEGPFGTSLPTRITERKLRVEQFYAACLCILTDCDSAVVTVLIKRMTAR